MHDPGQRSHRRSGRLAATAGVIALLAGCRGGGGGTATSTTSAPTKPPATAPALHGDDARAAGAVEDLERALREGDLERLCRPGAVLTAAVVTAMRAGGESCEASVEQSSLLRRPPSLVVTKVVDLRRDLAAVEVRPETGAAVPLDLIRTDTGWLVSFSDGGDPLGALARSS